jgi:prevent-host-death family protein
MGTNRSGEASVGIRELKNEASAIMRRVRRGEVVTITDRNRPVAVLVPLAPAPLESRLRELVRTGRLSWGGGKPAGSRRPAAVRGRPVAETVIADRR